MRPEPLTDELKTASPVAGSPRTGTGILAYQAINEMRLSNEIKATPDILPEQIQPASIDLRLGPVAYQVRASFLPGPEATVLDKIRQLDGYEINLREGAVFEKGCVYIIPLLESLELKASRELTGFANPKSSTGRLDVLTRLITDRGNAFDHVERGYKGPLYVEVAPRAFSIVVRTGVRLNQLRFRRGTPPDLTYAQLEQLYDKEQIIRSSDSNKKKKLLENKMLPLTIDLNGTGEGSRIGFRAKKHTTRIDVEKINHYDWQDFWEPLHYHKDRRLILDPNEFYILMTQEPVGVPPDHAAEMVAYHTAVGEFRVHYAGFFDPGFGWDGSSGKIGNSRAVLEVRSHEVPFLLEHDQIVGWLRYERMQEAPPAARLYGHGIGSNYQNQGLRLAKQFRDSGN